MTLEERVAKLEAQVARDEALEIRRDIAHLTAMMGQDMRAIREDLAWMRCEVTEIRRLLQRRHWWQF